MASKPKKKASKPAKPAAKPKATKPAAKPAAKAAAPKAAAAKTPAPAKPSSTKPVAAKPTAKPTAAQTTAAAAQAAAAAAAAAATSAAAAGKIKPKGITIVSSKPMKKPKPKKVFTMPELGRPLLEGIKKWKPLIASGPNAPSTSPIGGEAGTKPKSDMPKKDMEHYKQILLRKRAELVGDVSAMEGQALQGNSGSLSHVPQHIAEQGSEAFEQSLALDLAQVDRNLIKEIDDALERISNGTFGVCEMTHKQISKERLEELPWTRYSIEAARARERLHLKP